MDASRPQRKRTKGFVQPSRYTEVVHSLSMTLPRARAKKRRAILGLALCLLAVPETAQGATYTLRPDSTVTSNWTVTPTGSAAFAVLDDAVLQPTAPSTSSDHLSSSTVGNAAEIHVQTQPLAAGDTVLSTTAWAYLQPGPKRSITLTLLSGSTVLGSTTAAQASGTSWRSVTSNSALTQAQVDDLRLRVTMGGSGASTAGFAYAAYASVRTSGTLSSTIATAPSFSATLTGSDQTASYGTPLGVVDTRDISSGWNLTVGATQFSTGGANPSTLPANASSISTVASACTAPPCTSPTNSVTYPVAVTAGAPPVKFFNAGSGTGGGQFTITPTTGVAIPANADSGTYTSTVTYTVASGP